MHVAEVSPDLRGVESVDRDTKADTYRHDDQDNTEDRIDLADDLIDGDKGRDEVVDQDDCQPGRGLREHAGYALLSEQLDQKASRSDCEHGTNHDQKDNREYTHDVVHDRPKVNTGNLGDRCAVVSLGQHAGEIVMNGTGKNSTECDPQEHDRSPQSTLHGTEDRAEAGDVQQLYQEQLPCGHDNIVNAIIDRDCRGFTVIRSECIVYK